MSKNTTENRVIGNAGGGGGSVTIVGTVTTNLAQVGGAAIALGNTTMAASIPVTIASNDTLVDAIRSAVEFLDNTVGIEDSPIVLNQGIVGAGRARPIDGGAMPAVSTEGDAALNTISMNGIAYRTLTDPTGAEGCILVNDVAVGTGHHGVVMAGAIADTLNSIGTVDADGDATNIKASRSGILFGCLTDPAGTSDVGTAIKTAVEAINNSFNDDLVDTTNVAAATHYYPDSDGFTMDGYSDLSFSGKLIDGDGTLTLTIEATNDEDTSGGDWIQVYGYDDKNNAVANSWAVTNGTLTFANSFNAANYRYFRVKLVASGATNTVIVKARRKAA